MARYNYQCNDCSKGDDPSKWIIWEVQHGMNEKPKQKCPKCKGTNTTISYVGFDPPPFHTRGYGWLDVKGRRRDMNLHTLVNNDPYGHMREPGEKDELAHSLRKGGKHDPKAKRFFVRDSKRPK
jgi:hypothetical protein